MNELLAYYQEQAQKGGSTIPWLAPLQSQALIAFDRLGFPRRQDDDWKYTSVDAMMQQRFTRAAPHQSAQLFNANTPFKETLQVSNGVVLGVNELASQLPAGVLVIPLAQAIKEHAALLSPYLGKILQQQHGFHALNTALIDCGVFIYVPAGVIIDEPIALTHYQDRELQAVYLRHVIVAEAGSQLTLVEDFYGEEGRTYLTNTVTEVFLGEGAELTHYKSQRESKNAYHLGQISVKQSAASHFASHSFSLGGKLVRSDMDIHFNAPNGYCLLNGIYAPGEGQHVDHHTTIHHALPDCASKQDYKGILRGNSRAVFNGKVIVARDAQHTAAQQQNKNLLLSPKAEINTKPQLEIFADDVQCSHGATVGQLDEEALFYLATRGIDRLAASQYLIQAFAQDNLALMPHPKIGQWLHDLLTQQLS